MAVKVVIDQAALNKLLTGPDGPGAKYMARVGTQVEGRAKQLTSGELVNVDTGRLRSSISSRLFRRGDRIGVTVSSGVGYSIFVHEGTSRGLRARPFLAIAAREVIGKSLR